MRRLALLAISLALGLPALAGCGSSSNGVASKAPAEILTAARAAAQHASAVHVTSSSRVGPGSLTLNASFSTNRSRATLSFFGLDFEVIRVGNTLYVKGNQAFNAQLERALGIRVPRGRWLAGATTGTLAQIAAFADMKTEVPLLLSGRGTITKGSATKIDGQPTIELNQAHQLYSGALYIATTGQPYPVALRKTGRETGQTSFTNWNQPTSVDPPADVVELSTLEHKPG